MDTRLVVGVSQAGFLHDVEEEIGEVVDRILSVAVHASHYRRLHHQVATVVLAHLLRKEEDVLSAFGGEAKQQLTGCIGEILPCSRSLL